MRRVFIGIPAGAALVEAASAFRRSHAGFGVRWISTGNLHVTLVPPWETGDTGPLCRTLEAVAAGTPPIPVLFDRVSIGPDPRHPRLVWATGAAPEALAELAARLRRTFGNGGDTGRTFLLHLTLARLRRQSGQTSIPPGFSEPAAWDGVLDEIALYESILNPGGTEYRTLCRYPLPGIVPERPVS